jgi:hypothetical protein
MLANPDSANMVFVWGWVLRIPVVAAFWGNEILLCRGIVVPHGVEKKRGGWN